MKIFFLGMCMPAINITFHQARNEAIIYIKKVKKLPQARLFKNIWECNFQACPGEEIINMEETATY
jgi:hypothetical protein